MKNLISNFSGLAMSRMEMKKVKGGCAPPHWDVYVNGNLSFCALSKSGAIRAADSFASKGSPNAPNWITWQMNGGDC